ncbi:RNA ligase family protein [Kitasatospora sp. NPDC088351]|uniref:RNA ligase family protein n=1 Tax=Kitasatospora sp. NPDC088351 TaxID=3155180 RepID=UPI00341E4CFF
MSDIASQPPALLPYPKIPAGGRLGGFAVREWVAAEKVHGAHFAVVCDRSGVRPAKRRELLGDELLDGFFGVSRIWPALAVAAARFAAVLRTARGGAPGEPGGATDADGDDAVVTIYGELAGGRYPHPDVPAEPGSEPVQTGVWYAPGLHWLLFDAHVATASGDRRWISDRSLRRAAAAGLTCVPALGHGPLNTLQQLPSTFRTKVPAALGLPELDDNLAEGYVLKPAGEWHETDTPEAENRPVAKVKQPAFAEDARYNGARPYLPPPHGVTGVPAWLLIEATALLTPARAAAAVSKLGPSTPAAVVAAEIAQDAREEIASAIGGLEEAPARSLEQALLPGARTLALLDAADRRTGGERRGQHRQRGGGSVDEPSRPARSDDRAGNGGDPPRPPTSSPEPPTSTRTLVRTDPLLCGHDGPSKS